LCWLGPGWFVAYWTVFSWCLPSYLLAGTLGTGIAVVMPARQRWIAGWIGGGMFAMSILLIVLFWGWFALFQAAAWRTLRWDLPVIACALLPTLVGRRASSNPRLQRPPLRAAAEPPGRYADDSR
jgi:hypothetical protein